MKVRCMGCGREVPSGTFGRCGDCGGILRPEHGDDAIAALRTVEPGPGIDRYRAVLPTTAALPDLGEGDTPLLASRRLGRSLGLERVLCGRHLKVEPAIAWRAGRVDRGAA